MNFSSSVFILFFASSFVLFWVSSYSFSRFEWNKKLGQCILLVLSYIFYMSWDYRFGGLILLTTLIDFHAGKWIERSNSEKMKKLFLFASVSTNLGILIFFKYTTFLMQSVRDFLGFIHPETATSFPVMQILLPLGISFFTFQSMSYTIDVFRGIIPAEKSFLQYSLYLSFFPQLVAGPIVKAREFLPQLKRIPALGDVDWGRASYFLILGYFKKAVIADQISALPDFAFRYPGEVSGLYLLAGILGFAIQIYCDFSGYTDIARGCALLLGFELAINFNSPYRASSLSDFWQRWHISLSSWLKFYLYIPLGGNRVSLALTVRNLMIVMLLGGLWHGASWNFLIWGGLHGIWLSMERIVISQTDSFAFLRRRISEKIFSLMKSGYAMIIFLFIVVAWVFFRAENLPKALSVLNGILIWKTGLNPNYSMLNLLYASLVILFLGHAFGNHLEDQCIRLLSEVSFYKAFLLATAIILIVLFGGSGRPFIYFVF